MVKCPRCGLEVTELQRIDPALMTKLQAMEEISPEEVCRTCHSDLRKIASSAGGGILMAQERAKEQHRLQLWKSRVQLIKKARSLMNQKSYSEAAVAYEKYIKVLEIVFQCKKGELLSPEMFKESARTSELTVVASVYWDLLRIYDSSEKYGDRQAVAGKQLSKFIRFTPIFPDIIKKAEAFVRQAKNPGIIKQFLKDSAEQRPTCFIATSAFGGPLAIEVQILRHFRDHSLRGSRLGRQFIFAYYKYSPSIACFLDKHFWLKPAVRGLLRLMIKCVSRPS